MSDAGDMEDILKEFLAESSENLDQLDRDLVTLETDPASREVLGRVFRAIHTLKGTCGFFGFGRLESVAHVGESLLGRLREGELAMTPDIASGLLALVDAVRQMVRSIEASGREGDGDYAALIALLTGLREDRPAAPAAPAAERPSIEPSTAERTSPRGIRVDAALLDHLVNLAGELVLARNRMVQLTAGLANPTLAATAQRLNAITTELQERVMEARMQPIDVLWRTLPRLVRDVARVCGKPVRLETAGSETRLDRALLEAIKDPVTHLVRNAIDHGIEAPAVREARGKPAEGRLSLRASHESGHVVVEIADDGGGIDPERIRARARERGLLAPEQAARLSDGEAQRLIFLPGFSTAETVTTISGRGVGMDVVRANIERIGGTIDLDSAPGRGTRVTIRIPLTLAVIPALIVATDGHRYAIPEANLVELIHLDPEAARDHLEDVHGAPVYRLRGALLPLVSLRRALALPERDGPGPLDIAVLQSERRQLGLIVDDVLDTEEIVVKPLGESLAALAPYAAATLLGDGSVGIILDVAGLARSVFRHDEPLPEPAGATGTRSAAAAHPGDAVLLVTAPGGDRVALPVGVVSRIETIPAASIERVAGREVLQYRDAVLPLVRLTDVLAADAPPPGAASVQVVVCASGGRSVGLIVESVLDIVREPLALGQPGGRPGVLGSAVIDRRVTQVLDAGGLVRAAGEDHVPPAAAGAAR